MEYPNAETLAQSYAITQGLIERLSDGVSHEQSVVQPAFPGNCLNWVVGHILNGRDRALKLIGGEPVFNDEQYARYATGSEAIIREDDGVRLEELLSLAKLSRQRIVDTLDQVSPEYLAEIVDTQFGAQPRGRFLAGLHWHETYHTGQLELLRSLSLSTP